jgi:hypothetical protein
MLKSSKKLAENSHFKRPLTAWFSVWRLLRGFGQIAAKTRRKPLNRKLMSHGATGNRLRRSAQRSFSAPAIIVASSQRCERPLFSKDPMGEAG